MRKFDFNLHWTCVCLPDEQTRSHQNGDLNDLNLIERATAQKASPVYLRIHIKFGVENQEKLVSVWCWLLLRIAPLIFPQPFWLKGLFASSFHTTHVIPDQRERTLRYARRDNHCMLICQRHPIVSTSTIGTSLDPLEIDRGTISRQLELPL